MNAPALCLALFAGCFLSALLPLVNAEILVVSTAALAPRPLALPLAAIATVGQMLGKTTLYLVGRGAVGLPRGRVGDRLRNAVARLDGAARPTGLLLFVSAVTGLPPFFATSIASGLLRVRVGRFLMLGSSGRFLRFGALAVLPQVAALLRG